MKLGSLFDGSGGFPLAGSMCGIEPVWASEIEPYPIAVTRSRFPNMKHIGNVCAINGAEIEPQDIITVGSPCQDLSVAGKRAGLKHEANGDEETTRSGLFMEAVRIIREMREATNGVYPRFALWENVPGAFSSNSGEDFRIVLEELIKVVEPTAVMPEVPKAGWAYADSYCGDGWSIAYRVFDAQYWGVPQRRRRIHLVADFRGERARKVLFEREGVRGDFTQSGETREETAGDAESGIRADDREGKVYAVDQGGGKSGANIHNNISPTLTCTHGGEPAVAYTLKIRSGCEGGGKGALIQEDKSATLATNNDQYLFQPVPNLLLDDQGGQQINVRTDNKCPTLRAEAHGNVPSVVCEPIPIHDKATRYKGGGATRNGDGAGNGLGIGEEGSPMYTVTTGDKHAVAYPQQVYDKFIEDEIGTTLKACGGSYGGGSEILIAEQNKLRYIVRRLTPTECARLQGFPDRWGDIDEKTDFTDEEYKFWIEVRNTHAAINGKAVKEYTKEQMLNWYSKLHTDSAEYKMWGNGIALPPALYCMQGISEALNEGD